ncbi:AAA family ATPase [Microlunatus sp. Y2014]|uniref:AAA family ATPase n=1 Tax=Microlunatus sp. Y2014 TaxID=3418488 RepID=UPI003DA6D4BB
MADLSHVIWVGGPAGAGKTTVARRLARRHGLRWYGADTRAWVHRERAAALGVPLPDRGPGHDRYERGTMVLDDVRALPNAPLVVVEGDPILPSLTSAGGHAVWLWPSREVQRARLEQRHPDGIPPRYLATWERMSPVFDGPEPVDGELIIVDALDIEATVLAVATALAPTLDAGPRADSVGDRQAMLRYGNQSIIGQYLSPATKPLTPVSSDVAADFDCECGRQECRNTVRLRVVDARDLAASGRTAILAPGHG